MIKFNRTTWDKATDSEKIAYCNGLRDDSKKSRRLRDFEWYMNYQFDEGNHYVYYNTTTNKLENKPRTKGEVRVVINKVKSTVRAVQNYSTRFNPKWEILPGGLEPEIIDNARRSGKFMDFFFRTQHMEIVLQGLVDSVLNTSVAFVELDWDDKAEGGMGQVMLIEHDSFDVWLDSRAKIYAGLIKGRYIFKGVTKDLDEIRNDERYNVKVNDAKERDAFGEKATFNREMVQPDKELAASDMKSRILQKEGLSTEEQTKRATVYEFQLFDEEGNDNGGNIQLFTYAGDRVLRDEPLKNKGFTIYCMQVPQDTKKIYHRTWVADLIPLNKILNRTVSQKVMYVNQALTYRVLAEKGHGINKFTNEMGEFLEHNKGRSVVQMQPYPLPADGDQLENRINGYIEDIGGAHEAALGRMPTGARSGKVLEALQAADSNNLSGIRISIESFLSVLGSAILDIVAEKYVASRIAQITDPEIGADGTKQNYISIIGEGANDKIKNDQESKHTIINKGNALIVKIGSWLGNTTEARKETLYELADRKIIPGDEVLRQLEFPNIESLSQKAQEERLEEHKMDAEIAGRNQETEQVAPPVNTKADSESRQVALADKENLEMLQGVEVPPTEGIGLEHTQAHVDFSQSQDFQQQSMENPALKQIMQAHIQGELEMQGILATEEPEPMVQ